MSTYNCQHNEKRFPYLYSIFIIAGAASLACQESISHLLLCSLLDGSHDDIFKVSINCGLVNLNNLTK